MNWKNFNLFGKTSKTQSASELEKSDFEKIKVFKNLPKEQWKTAYNELNNRIGERLKEYGFEKKDRKHYRLTHDLLEVIDVDNRGSWTGATYNITIRIGLVPYCWEGLINEYYLVGSKKIEEIDKTIRKHFTISQEYLILADYLAERIIENILPFFDQYNSSHKIITQADFFPFYSNCGGADIYHSQYLRLFSELKQHKITHAIEIINNEIKYHNRLENLVIVQQWIELKTLIDTNKWTAIDSLLVKNEKLELQKLKINSISTNHNNFKTNTSKVVSKP